MDNFDVVVDLAGRLVCHMEKPAWPGLDDPKCHQKAIKLAKEQGHWDCLTEELSSPQPVPVINYSNISDAMTGVKSFQPHFNDLSAKRGQLKTAILGCWLGHPKADIDLVHNSMWSWCETTSWIRLFHKEHNPGADLASSATAMLLAEGLYLLRDQIDETVRIRVEEAIHEKFLEPATSWKYHNWWTAGKNNWNHVVLSNLIGTGLYVIKDVYNLAFFLHPLIENLKYGLLGYTEDGGCTEGPDYWIYGFSHFMQAAYMLHYRTGSELNIVDGYDKIDRICDYPQKIYIDNFARCCWADSWYGKVPTFVALLINKFMKKPELFSLCPVLENGDLQVDGSWRSLVLYNGETHTKTILRDGYLPDLGSVKVYAAGSRNKCALAVTAGNNGVNHNHNDIGSFIFYKNGSSVLTDPGYPTYCQGNFDNETRYKCIYNSSFGHSVPIINGNGQPVGSEYHGDIKVDGLDSQGTKTISIDMSHAYDVKSLKSLSRQFILSSNQELVLTDTFEFSAKPKSLTEQFITYCDAAVDGDTVIIKDGRKTFSLSCENCEGIFTVERLEEESKQGRGQGIISRIRFVPRILKKKIELSFVIE